jgi:hypothetical protein
MNSRKVTEHGIMDDINDEHPEKQLQPRYFTEFWIARDDKEKTRNIVGPEVMYSCYKKIVELAVQERNRVRILGAFSCGIFGNDPKMITVFSTKY